MKWLFILAICLPVYAQDSPNPEIFLFDLEVDRETVTIKNGANVSRNMGYDNQPSFYSNEELIYSKTRKGQTDIAGYNLESKENFWISNTNMGSEYSPSRIPGRNEVAAVRLDTTGLQRLYNYNRETGKNTLLHEDLKIGYFAFFDDNKILATVLTGNGMDLVLINLEEQSFRNIIKGAGRSLHKVPETATMSYTLINEQGGVELFLLENIEDDPESVYFTTLPSGVQDYVWLDKNRILAGQGNKILLYDIWGEGKWKEIAELSEYDLHNITRLAVNEAGNKMAIAAEIQEK